MDGSAPDPAALTAVKAALDLYLAQYSATDRLRAYFSTVTIAVLGFSVGSDKVSKSFLEASIVVAGYVVFCVGNYRALALAQAQLIQFAALAQGVAARHKVDMSALKAFSVDDDTKFCWAVVVAVCAGILVITYRRRLRERQAS